MKNRISSTCTVPVVKRRAPVSRPDGPGADELARIGAHWAQARHEDSPNISVGSSKTVCVRYTLVDKQGKFCGHRRSGGYGYGTRSHSVFGAFEHARIWARESDAARYREQRDYANVEIVAVTCAVGRPYAIFTEAP